MMTESERKHFEKYDEMARKVGIDSLKRKIGMIRHGKTRISAALAEGDVYLNNIPLREWDRISGVVVSGTSEENISLLWDAVWKKMGNVQSAADRVCILKHVAKHYYLEEK